MRALRQYLAFCLTMGTLAGSGYAAESIRWETDLPAATERAKVLGRPLLLHFSTEDCAPCRRLKETVFSQPIVQAAMQDHFVPVHIDANQHPELAARFRVTSVPHDVILMPDQREVHRMTSPLDPEQYLAQLSAAAFRAGTLRSSPVAQSPHDPPQLGSSGMDRAWSDAGRDPSRPDPRFHDGRPQAYSAAPTGDHARQPGVGSYPTDSGARADTADASPHEVINRFARRGRDDSGAPAAPAADSVPPQQDPLERASRWGNWDQSAAPDAVADGPPPTARGSNGAAVPGGPPLQDHADDLPPRRDRPQAGSLAAGQPAQAAAAHPPLGLDGYCAVSLVRDNRWTKGDPRYGVIHRGRTYLFAGPEEKEIFFADPDEYSPVLAGVDPVELTTSGQTIEGRRAHGVVYQKRVYLFASEQNLQQFWEEPERYARPIRQAMENGDVGRLFR